MRRRQREPNSNEQEQRSISSSTDSNIQHPRTRGPTTLAWLFTRAAGGHKLELIWDEFDGPVGPKDNVSLFSDSIGTLMRSSRRFDWTKDWPEVSEDSKNWLWRELNRVWELDECRRKPTINTLSSKIFRNSKSNWKKIYNKFTTDDARKAAQPSDLSHKEWSDLLEHWGDPEHQEMCERNKVNRSKQRVKHTTGKRSHAQVIYEMTMENGAPPSLGELFVKSHTHARTQDTLDDVSREYIEQMKELAGTDEEGNQMPLTDDIYWKVVLPEREGRVRRTGVTRTRFFHSQSSSHGNNTSTQMEQMQRELDEMKTQAKEKEEEIERRYKAREEEMEKRDKAREEEIQMMRRQQGQLVTMLQGMINLGQNGQFSMMLQGMLSQNQSPTDK